MNERIKELMLEAGFTERVTETTDGRELHEPVFNAEKFAELIVKECAAVANYRSDGHEVNQFGSKKFLYFTDIGQEILEYFGVE